MVDDEIKFPRHRLKTALRGVLVVELAPLDFTRSEPLGGVVSRHNSTPNGGGGRLNSLLPLKPMSIIGEVSASDLPNYHLVN